MELLIFFVIVSLRLIMHHSRPPWLSSTSEGLVVARVYQTTVKKKSRIHIKETCYFLQLHQRIAAEKR